MAIFSTVSLIGSTGSIGKQAAEVVLANPQRFDVIAIGAHSSIEILAEQAKLLRPQVVALADESKASALQALLEPGVELRAGRDALPSIATEADVVLNGVVGFAGLPVTMAALSAGKRLALANKESLIAAGPLVQKLRNTPGAELLPVDSEHGAIHQCLRSETAAGDRERERGAARTREQDAREQGVARDGEQRAGTHMSPRGSRDGMNKATTPVFVPEPEQRFVSRLVLTASGGPFRGQTASQLADVTRDQALAHPTWKMGPKITIDSSTLFNKGLEVIEAHELFGTDYDQIDVTVHPQSIIHSAVTFTDGSTIAQLSQPDMRLPIGYALGHPDRLSTPYGALDWANLGPLTFEQPDLKTFRCLALAYQAGRAGGTVPAWLNAANEVAVQAFLDEKVTWLEIASIIEETIDCHDGKVPSSIEVVIEADAEARRFARQAVDRRKTK